jgi:hypothetical protein
VGEFGEGRTLKRPTPGPLLFLNRTIGGVSPLLDRLFLWLDNPILVKHCRSRLRQMHLLPSVAIVMVLALSIVLLGYYYNGLRGGETFGGLMSLQAVMGAWQVALSVGKARDSGILDFHRVTPMSPFSMALGFFFGAPIREYLMFAATLPFSIICVFMGTPSIAGFFQLLVPLVIGAWVMHSISLLSALGGKSSKSGSGSRGAIGLVIFLIFGGGYLVWGFMSAAKAVDDFPTGTFFSIRLPWLVILAVDMFPVIGFFLVASTRKIASERAHSLSKGQAIGCLTTAATLILGGLWNIEVEFFWTFVVLYALILGTIILTSAITPGRDEFAKGIRKAAKEGRKYPSAWSDRGLNRIGVFCLCGVVLVASTICSKAIERPVSWFPPQMNTITFSYSLPIAIGVLAVAYNGLAVQFFSIRFGKRGPIFFALFLFTAWLVPLVCGAIARAAYIRNSNPQSPPDIWSPALASLSPIIGIVFSSGLANIPGLREAQACALMPALVFALLFNNLVTSARRRIEKEIHPEPAPNPKAKPEPETDGLVEPVMSA